MLYSKGALVSHRKTTLFISHIHSCSSDFPTQVSISVNPPLFLPYHFVHTFRIINHTTNTRSLTVFAATVCLYNVTTPTPPPPPGTLGIQLEKNRNWVIVVVFISFFFLNRTEIMSNYNYPHGVPYGGHHGGPPPPPSAHYPPAPYPPESGGYGVPLHHQGSGYGHPQYPPQQLPPSMYQHASNSPFSSASNYGAFHSQNSFSSQSPHNSGSYASPFSHTSARTYEHATHSTQSPLQAPPPPPPTPGQPRYAPNFQPTPPPPPQHLQQQPPPHPPPPGLHAYPHLQHESPYAPHPLNPYANYAAYPPSSAYPVGSHMWCEAVRREARDAFFKADCDASGYLDVQEFYAVIRSLVGALVSYQEALQYFAKTDTDRNGRIGLNEFERLYVDEIARRRYWSLLTTFSLLCSLCLDWMHDFRTARIFMDTRWFLTRPPLSLGWNGK